ncbi:HlyD family secretion protein [bacterium]|nr:HlyD family secretion protein [Porticoccaceae bacterium]MDB4322276.1 HlyD family secretion protein [bacterium]MDB4077208.1 HlyD family secretion protein [Porticoccaceae bacterium]MDB4262983.1 HlyD family secretion protein [Porticoccaceae bacterium]MDB4308357.1 HlyD family secretion protein [Porticoccaceae bacterium]
MTGGRHVETDNAYLKANMVSISSEVSAKVVEVLITDNSPVEAGDVLFRVDDQPYQIALIRAQANLVKVGGDLESLKADYLNKLADLNKAKTQQTFYLGEYNRLNKVLVSNTVSEVQVAQARYDYQDALNEVQVTTQALLVVEARLISLDLPLQEHPNYLLALAELDQAKLNLSYIEITAPSSGVVANLNMQKGEYIIAGAPLFSLVDNGNIWVEANFKETDLTHLRAGQVATITVDTYPDLKWQAIVASITPGTGSEFSLLPAQNSSGNWVKVVQRVNVKLTIDQALAPTALTPGMSALVNVDTEHSRQLPWFN